MKNMKFLKDPKRIKYTAKGKDNTYSIIKQDDKYWLYSGEEYNWYLYSAKELKMVKDVARVIELEEIL